MHACNQIIRENQPFIQSVSHHLHPSYVTFINPMKILHARRWETSAAKQDLASNQKEEGWEKVGRWAGLGGPFPRRASPFVAALATLRRSGAGDRPNLGRNTWAPGEGQNPQSQPSHPASPHCPSMHPAPPPPIPTSQFAVGQAYQPAFPVSKNTNQREEPTRSSLRRPCFGPLPVCFCQSLTVWSIVFFSFFFAFSYLACIQAILPFHTSRLLHLRLR